MLRNFQIVMDMDIILMVTYLPKYILTADAYSLNYDAAIKL